MVSYEGKVAAVESLIRDLPTVVQQVATSGTVVDDLPFGGILIPVPSLPSNDAHQQP